MKRAVCVFIQNDRGEVLGVSRRKDLTNFGMPGGKVELGETDKQAVVRELFEETGLTIHNPIKIFQHTAEREYWTSCWTGVISGTIVSSEEGEVRWVSPEVLASGCFGEYNRTLFTALGLDGFDNPSPYSG